MSDLIERLRGTKQINDPFPVVFWDLTQEAADALEAKDKRIAELEGAALDLFVHDKRETRTALRDLVGGFDAVAAHRSAAAQEGEGE